MKIQLNEEQVNQLNTILNDFPIRETARVQAISKLLAENTVKEEIKNKVIKNESNKKN
tara:strand:- start:3685 stop:3858 length:174 start_codon:yes stop_codon:yes gene_type:complete